MKNIKTIILFSIVSFSSIKAMENTKDEKQVLLVDVDILAPYEHEKFPTDKFIEYKKNTIKFSDISSIKSLINNQKKILDDSQIFETNCHGRYNILKQIEKQLSTEYKFKMNEQDFEKAKQLYMQFQLPKYEAVEKINKVRKDKKYSTIIGFEQKDSLEHDYFEERFDAIAGVKLSETFDKNIFFKNMLFDDRYPQTKENPYFIQEGQKVVTFSSTLSDPLRYLATLAVGTCVVVSNNSELLEGFQTSLQSSQKRILEKSDNSNPMLNMNIQTLSEDQFLQS